MQSVLETAGADKPSTLQWIEYGALKGLPFLILLVLLVLFATRSEEKSFQAIVAGEPDPMVITDAEITSLRSLIARRSARSAAGRLRGPKGSKLTGQLQAAQIEYAMIRSRVDSVTDPALDAQRLKIHAIREQLGRRRCCPARRQGRGAGTRERARPSRRRPSRRRHSRCHSRCHSGRGRNGGHRRTGRNCRHASS